MSFGQDSTKTEKALRVVPLITSSPLMGFGAGFAVSYLYNTDAWISSKSQLQIGGQPPKVITFSLITMPGLINYYRQRCSLMQVLITNLQLMERMLIIIPVPY